MNLKPNDDGTFTCGECGFIFGQKTIDEMGDGFNTYHQQLHKIVMA